MAAAVASSSSAAFAMGQHRVTPSQASVSTSPEPSNQRTFHRFRASLEQSIRSATRTKRSSDDFGLLKEKGKEKEKDDVGSKPKGLRRLESKMTFGGRRAGRESVSPVPPPLMPVRNEKKQKDRVGLGGFVAPSLRGASVSSPALHLSSQALPSPNSRSAVPVSSSSSTDVLASPTRERKRSSLQAPTASSAMKERDIGPPSLLSRQSKRHSTQATTSSSSSSQPSTPSRQNSRHRSTQSQPVNLPSSPSTPALLSSSRALAPTPELSGSSRTPSPPSTPTPASGSRHHQLRLSSSRRAAHSSGHLPASSGADTPDSPTTPRGLSPIGIRSRSPSMSGTRSRVLAPTAASQARGISSSSSSHLPLSQTPPSPSPLAGRRGSMDGHSRRPTVDLASRRPSLDSRRPSLDNPRRPSLDAPQRRPSLDAPRRSVESPSPSPTPSRTRPPIGLGYPSQLSQLSAQPPALGRSYSHNPGNGRFNVSTSSLTASGPPNPEHRELIRTATSMLCKEVGKPPVHGNVNKRDWEEVQSRMRNLLRLERIWGKMNGASSSNVNLSNGDKVGALSSSGLSATGEDRERRLFCESLRDGYVLCQLMNKLRSSSIVKPDPREDGFSRTSNVTKFLAACSSYGMPSKDLFLRDDLLEASSESLARVARTVIKLIQFVDTPTIGLKEGDRRAKVLTGQAKKLPSSSSSNPYGSRAGASSVPNLIQRPTSPTGLPPPSPVQAQRKRYTPPSGLEPVRSQSPSPSSSAAASPTPGRNEKQMRGSSPVDDDDNNDRHKGTRTTNIAENQLPSSDPLRANERMTLSPPPKSPLRSQRSKSKHLDKDGNGLFNWAMNAMNPSRSGAASPPPSTKSRATAASTTAAPVEFPRSVSSRSGKSADGKRKGPAPDRTIRQSVASTATATTAMSDTTVTTAVSSLMDVGRTISNGFKFGTIRTITTDATSISGEMSLTKTQGSSIAEELKNTVGGAVGGRRDKKSSMEKSVVDLTRVAEEDSGGSSRSGPSWQATSNRADSEGGRDQRQANGDGTPRSPVLRLGKGKWPDDFIDAIQAHNNSRPSLVTSSTPPDQREDPQRDRILLSSSPTSASPPRKVAIVGASRRNDSVESLQQFPRRPSHRPRHSIDTPGGLLPKESVLRRDVSPDGSSSASSGTRVMLRRHSTKPGPSRNGVYIPRSSLDGNDRRSSGDSEHLIPFPRTASGDLRGSPSKPSPLEEHAPRPPRGRFQSDLQASTLRRPRPNSFDEFGGARPPHRSRIESMVNLGVVSSNASASDIMARDSITSDGSMLRKTLILKDEGKAPTHFQLGNCIGRGQFGAVYRALNLNTGQMVAVKRIRLEGLKDDEVTQLMREVDLVKRLSHPSIVKYEGMSKDDDSLSIVLEYAENGSLAHTLKAFGKLNERLVASYVVKILEGLHYLHSSDVVHCDLKAANILTTKTGNVKLSDFGVSLNMRAVEREIKDVAGTPNWMAPEVIELKGASPKSDIWSLACTVIELLTGRPPYAEIANSMSVMFRIVEDDKPPLPEAISPLLVDFLNQCFHKDPSKRPTAVDLCEHEWLKKNWVGHKELRPKDSIPFLRRVSADYQKVDAIRILTGETPESPKAEPSPRLEDFISASPPRARRMSSTSTRPAMGDSDISPREHSFVKTTFSKPMICRVCLLNVKKSAVLCSECSLIAHSRCAPNAPPTCDLRSQLLLYAQYAEKGNPTSQYSNPLDQLGDAKHPTSPMSDVSYVAHTPRTSFDMVRPPPTPIVPQTPTAENPHPPTAFKFMAAAFKRSRNNLTIDPGKSNTSVATKDSAPSKPNKLEKGSKGKNKHNERPRSFKSDGSHAKSSLKSAATAPESISSAGHLVARSAMSHDGDGRSGPTDEIRSSRFTSTSGTSSVGESNILQSIPGGLANPTFEHPATPARRHKKPSESKSSGNCMVQ